MKKAKNYTVTKDKLPKFRGDKDACFNYILKHQGNSVDHATKYEGWAIEETTLESVIIEGCLSQDAFGSGRRYSKSAMKHAYARFQGEMGRKIVRQGSLTACIDWFQGLALEVPYMNYEIEQLGFDSETYWEDIAETFLILNGNLRLCV